jgi:hypothetical protein
MPKSERVWYLTYLHKLVVGTGKLRSALEWPVLGEEVTTAKAEVHAGGTSELMIPAVA